MQPLIANYSTPAEIQRDHFLTSTVGTSIRKDQFKSTSLFVLADDQYFEEFRINNRIFSLLYDFTKLPDNWDEEGALAPNRNALSSAYFIVQTLTSIGQQIFNIAPGPNSEVMLDIRDLNNTKSVELIFYADRMVAVYFPGSGKPYQEDFQPSDLPSVLSWLNP